MPSPLEQALKQQPKKQNFMQELGAKQAVIDQLKPEVKTAVEKLVVSLIPSKTELSREQGKDSVKGIGVQVPSTDSKPAVKNDLQELANKAKKEGVKRDPNNESQQFAVPLVQAKKEGVKERGKGPTETESFFDTTSTLDPPTPTVVVTKKEVVAVKTADSFEVELPKLPTPEAVKQKQDKLNPNPQPTAYPITIPEINIGDPFLQMVEVKEKDRILTEINLLKFAIKSALKPADYYMSTVRRSGAHKLQTIFNISTQIVCENVWKEEEQWIAKYRVKAIAPNGRSTEAIGICEQNEKGRKRTRHDTEATAQTRATSRAILDLVGFGAVSKEEIDDGGDAFQQ